MTVVREGHPSALEMQKERQYGLPARSCIEAGRVLRAKAARGGPLDLGGRRSASGVTKVRAAVAPSPLHTAGTPSEIPVSALQWC